MSVQSIEAFVTSNEDSVRTMKIGPALRRKVSAGSIASPGAMSAKGPHVAFDAS